MGGVSQLRAELLAFSTALEHGQYDYFHLISGQDLPLKSQDYVHNFFDALPHDSNCISIEFGDNIDKIHAFNCGYYHLFTNKTRCHNVYVRKICSLIRRAFIRIQKISGYQRDWSGYVLGKGTNWASLSYPFVNYLVTNRDFVIKRFTGVLGPDEIYKHTLLLSSKYKDTIMSFLEISNSLRHIDWNRGLPYVWRKNDFKELKDCNELFARKFNSAIDKEIIDSIYTMLKGHEYEAKS